MNNIKISPTLSEKKARRKKKLLGLLALVLIVFLLFPQRDVREYTEPKPEQLASPILPAEDRSDSSDTQPVIHETPVQTTAITHATDTIEKNVVISKAETESVTVINTDAELFSAEINETVGIKQSLADAVAGLCTKVGNKLGSVSIEDCNEQGLKASGYWTDEGNPLAFKNYLPIANKRVLGKVLIIGGIHGDEYSSISIMFKWMKILDQHHSGIIDWRFIPAANPDGLFKKPATRQNGNGVDLNRNFPSKDWNELALKYWKNNAGSTARRYPGRAAMSETETQWLVKVIDEYNPDIVVSVHAPYELLDYDGPDNPPSQIGNLYLSQLGVFPGSLGNYGGVDLGKPIVTLELPSAGIMPPRSEINKMWVDLVRWLLDKLQTIEN